MASDASSIIQAPFRVTSSGWVNLPKMDIPRTAGFIGDTYENPENSEMCSGYFELHHTEEPLYYEYAYDEMKIVIEGEFLMESKETGQKLVAKAKDAIFFPKGSKIYFSTPDRALAFYVGHRSGELL